LYPAFFLFFDKSLSICSDRADKCYADKRHADEASDDLRDFMGGIQKHNHRQRQNSPESAVFEISILG
jgi:hypothetical protein